MTGVTFTVDPWDPGYGQALSARDGPSLEDSSAELHLDFELPRERWQPLSPDPAARPPEVVAFLDGVRRIDARVWVHGVRPQPAPGIAASLAVGLVRCDLSAGPRSARVDGVRAERGLFTACEAAAEVVTRHARYPVVVSRGDEPDQLSLAVQRRLSEAEESLAMTFRNEYRDGDDLLIVDGPLRGRRHLDRTVGYIKTHQASYLPAAQSAVVGALAPGQRTPAFVMGTTWRRTSWYLRLDGAGGAASAASAASAPTAPSAPWAGVVRLECSADLPRPGVVALADQTAMLLPRLAASPHKDPRAPQNLVPIGGLERELRHRLGDPQLLYRSLRAAATAASAATA